MFLQGYDRLKRYKKNCDQPEGSLLLAADEVVTEQTTTSRQPQFSLITCHAQGTALKRGPEAAQETSIADRPTEEEKLLGLCVTKHQLSRSWCEIPESAEHADQQKNETCVRERHVSSSSHGVEGELLVTGSNANEETNMRDTVEMPDAGETIHKENREMCVERAPLSLIGCLSQSKARICGPCIAEETKSDGISILPVSKISVVNDHYPAECDGEPSHEDSVDCAGNESAVNVDTISDEKDFSEDSNDDTIKVECIIPGGDAIDHITIPVLYADHKNCNDTVSMSSDDDANADNDVEPMSEDNDVVNDDSKVGSIRNNERRRKTTSSKPSLRHGEPSNGWSYFTVVQ